MTKLLKLLIIFSLVAAGAVAVNRTGKINFVPSAQAVGDLSITWEDTPLFNLPNFLPGDSVAKTVTISNGATSNRPLGLRVIPISDPASLSSQIKFTVKQNGVTIFDTNQTLADLFAQASPPGYLQFATLPPSQSAVYEFLAVFNPDAPNLYQDTSVIFNVTIGIAFDLPGRCNAVYSDKIIFGTSKSENLPGTPQNDIILAFEGDDKVEGGNGDDCILGGDGDDRLIGNNGKDVIFGDAGNDRLFGNNQDDYLDGGSGNDRTEGNNGTDTCVNWETRLHCEI